MPVEGDRERTHISLGSYKPGELGAVVAHARDNHFAYQTVQGPRDHFQLADGSKIDVPPGETAVVIIPRGPKTVERFWETFPYPEGNK